MRYTVNFNYPNGESFEINSFSEIKEAIELFDKTKKTDVANPDFDSEDVEIELKKFNFKNEIQEITLNELPMTHKQYAGWMIK